jgi:hypothetical protein
MIPAPAGPVMPRSAMRSVTAQPPPADSSGPTWLLVSAVGNRPQVLWLYL